MDEPETPHASAGDDEWIDLLASDDVEPSAIKAVDVGEVELVVWKDVDGVPCVMDARCPHLWSHLEAEGTIVGYEIVCAAHFWRFDARGVGHKHNMRGRPDRKSNIRVYPCRVVDGVVQTQLEGPESGTS